MNTNNVKLVQNSAQTLEEYEAVLEIYKKKNPEKYADKLAKGEFEKFKSKLPGYVAPKEEPSEPKGNVNKK